VTLGLAGPAAAQLPGRLFLTPAERAHLDELRATRSERATAAQPETTPSGDVAAIDVPPPPPPEPFTVNGLVVRSDGPNTAWVDGRPVLRPGQTQKGVEVDTRAAGAAGELMVLDAGVPVLVKPGQTYIPEGQHVTEPFEAPPAAGPPPVVLP
jgi:hypothetical protein